MFLAYLLPYKLQLLEPIVQYSFDRREVSSHNLDHSWLIYCQFDTYELEIKSY